jgi:hypothetical protein
MDVVQHFISHLHEELCQQAMKDFNYNPAISKKNTYSQSSNLLEALQHATTAEEQKASFKNMITQHMQGNQTMIANLYSFHYLGYGENVFGPFQPVESV